jgi:hypothetical protein
MIACESKPRTATQSRLTFVGAGIFLLFCSWPLLAHHSFAAEFDANKPLKLKGAVSKIECG